MSLESSTSESHYTPNFVIYRSFKFRPVQSKIFLPEYIVCWDTKKAPSATQIELEICVKCGLKF